MLEQHVYPAILLGSLHHGQTLERVVKVGRLIVIVGQGRRTVLEDVYDVNEVLVDQNSIIGRLLTRIELHVVHYVIQQVLGH